MRDPQVQTQTQINVRDGGKGGCPIPPELITPIEFREEIRFRDDGLVNSLTKLEISKVDVKSTHELVYDVSDNIARGRLVKVRDANVDTLVVINSDKSVTARTNVVAVEAEVGLEDILTQTEKVEKFKRELNEAIEKIKQHVERALTENRVVRISENEYAVIR